MIRKLLLISFLFFVAVASLLAQANQFEKEWNVGASFGVNLSQASFATSRTNTPFKTKSWQQYQGGLSIRYLSEKNLGLIAEINFSQQGWKQNFEDKDASEAMQETLAGLEHQHQLNYVEIPFLTHIYFGRKVRFFINLGPKIGYLLSEKETLNDNLKDFLASGQATQGFETGQFYQKADRKFDYGIVVGGGLEFRTGIGHFSLEGRYTFGLADFFSNSKADHFQRSANRVIGVKMNYYIKVF